MRAPAIITSKTRRHSPNGRTVALRDPERRETRITDERGADRMLKYSRWETRPKVMSASENES